MSTITKEWLESQISAIKVVGITDSNTLQAFEIALASLEAEAVGYMNRFTGRVFTLEEQPGADTDVNVYVPVYAAPPAPVSVPFAIHDEDFEKALSVLNDTLDDCGDSERGLLLALDKAGIEVRIDACRAAAKGE
ncbi:hypothetical protein N8Y70_22805 [Enterobacter hormaechei subsp. hoffmannii]|nr:hypothetical protein [Enterobacter hormaechei subsp. hoffmannii]